MRHLVNFNGTFMCCGEFKRNVPNVTRTSSLLYEGVIKAVREYLRAKKIALADYKSGFKTKAWFYIERGNKSVQSVLAGSETTPAAVGRWNEQFDELN